jgi:hypothetical protein
LIDAAGALGALVHLLERDEVRVGGADDGGDALEVDLAVHPLRRGGCCRS